MLVLKEVVAEILIEGVIINIGEGGSVETSAVGTTEVPLSKHICYPLWGKIESEDNHTRFV